MFETKTFALVTKVLSATLPHAVRIRLPNIIVCEHQPLVLLHAFSLGCNL